MKRNKPFVTVVNKWADLPDNLSCMVIWYQLPKGNVLHIGETDNLRWYLFHFWKHGFGLKARENGVQIVAIPAKVKVKTKKPRRRSVKALLRDFAN